MRRLLALIFSVAVLAPLWDESAGAGRRDSDRLREAVTERALEQVGKPYRWGADGPSSFDCSGLTLYAMRAAGVRLRHWTGYQIRRGRRVVGRLLPADLIFTHRGHVALYLGDGRIVEAPRSGLSVRVRSISRSEVYEARRVIG